MKKKKRFLVNENIKSEKLLVIGPDGNNLGVLSRNEALSQAKEHGFDLILVGEKADPPVAKIRDLRKFLYEKRQTKKKAKTKKKGTKEFRFGPTISGHDLETKINRARLFLEKGNKIKFTIVFKGREISHKKIGLQKFEKIMSELGEASEYEQTPYFQGKQLMAVVRKK